eukprot:CAMPEP_0180832350 /NCGR_PEP_ID=MMETSP1038_2-20121128/76791_1 /TAXON_ID=632150 /ORGANISM="Azadinium spinosum, Strain 3D9" /LENGTH=180 /DNA_ID=CAMNT_0022875541 /DNA_START=40 /DNA_END=583 /DNA_ORIENTATION=+
MTQGPARRGRSPIPSDGDGMPPQDFPAVRGVHRDPSHLMVMVFEKRRECGRHVLIPQLCQAGQRKQCIYPDGSVGVPQAHLGFGNRLFAAFASHAQQGLHGLPLHAGIAVLQPHANEADGLLTTSRHQPSERLQSFYAHGGLRGIQARLHLAQMKHKRHLECIRAPAAPVQGGERLGAVL